jgi:uncharacterized membrane protein
MSKAELYKFIHVLAAIIWAGGAATSQVVALRLKKADPGHRLGFARDMRFVAQWLFIPSGVIAFVFGSLLVEEMPAFDYEQTWLVIGNAGLIVALLIAAAYLVPHIRKSIRLMEAGQGEAAGATLRRVALGARLVVLILIVIVWAMVTKPGL